MGGRLWGHRAMSHSGFEKALRYDSREFWKCAVSTAGTDEKIYAEYEGMAATDMAATDMAATDIADHQVPVLEIFASC